MHWIRFRAPTIWHIDALFVKEVIQGDGCSNEYEASDRLNNNSYFFVPNYSASKVKEDIKGVERFKYLQSIIDNADSPSAAPTRSAAPSYLAESPVRLSHLPKQRQNEIKIYEKKVQTLEQQNKDLQDALNLLKAQVSTRQMGVSSTGTVP